MSKDFYKQYYLYGELGFPYPDRAYFDYIGTDFKYNSIQQKLLDIGYMLWHNYDVRELIHCTYSDAHMSVTENNVRYTICILLGELLQTNPIHLRLKYKDLSMNSFIDIFFSYLLRYYHMDPEGKHYIKSPENMTEEEIKSLNPWREVVKKYECSEFLYSHKYEFVCEEDKDIIKAFNSEAKDEYKYHLNVPAYPWYGNPLKAKVIVLSLNPGYSERESLIARVIQKLSEGYTEGYTEHLRSMMVFECGNFLPFDEGFKGMTYRDVANLHQSWYWYDRLNNAFVNDETGLSFEDVNHNFAIIQYIGYSSVKYHQLKKGTILPSQHYTRQLIEYILNNKDAIFIVPRNVGGWKQFLDNLWDDDRFIISKDFLGQRFTKKILGEETFNKVVKAFRNT